jgi:hypothetical protein
VLERLADHIISYRIFKAIDFQFLFRTDFANAAYDYKHLEKMSQIEQAHFTNGISYHIAGAIITSMETEESYIDNGIGKVYARLCILITGV